MSSVHNNAFANAGGWSDADLKKIPEYKAKIIDGIRNGLFLSEITTTLGLRHKIVAQWRLEDPEFAQDYSDAEETFVDSIEKEAIRRAVHGIQEPIVFKGKVVTDGDGDIVYSRHYSDSLMQFILKGRRRSVYGDRREIDANVKFDASGARDTLEQKLAAAIDAASEDPVSKLAE